MRTPGDLGLTVPAFLPALSDFLLSLMFLAFSYHRSRCSNLNGCPSANCSLCLSGSSASSRSIGCSFWNIASRRSTRRRIRFEDGKRLEGIGSALERHDKFFGSHTKPPQRGNSGPWWHRIISAWTPWLSWLQPLASRKPDQRCHRSHNGDHLVDYTWGQEVGDLPFEAYHVQRGSWTDGLSNTSPAKVSVGARTSAYDGEGGTNAPGRSTSTQKVRFLCISPS